MVDYKPEALFRVFMEALEIIEILSVKFCGFFRDRQKVVDKMYF